MEFKASHRYARMGVRKARLVMDLLRGRTVNQALDTLDNDRHRASRSIAKVLRSAVANALQNPEVRANRLVVSEAFCNEGPLLQNRMRFRPSAMGRALPFRRRTCHIHIKIKDSEVQAGTAEDQDSGEDASVEETGPVADGPVADEPVADEPATDEPAADEPATDEPATKEPATDKPATKEDQE